jgi:sigma-B regulation protein RsbU (phosphoserine phosphatase)
MTPLKIFGLKNRMLFYNIFTNLIGVWIIILLSFRSISPPFYEIAEVAHQINMLCIPVFFSFIVAVQISYELPIRKYLNSLIYDSSENEDLRTIAKRRLLNAPFFIIGMDLSFWFAGAIIYAVLYNAFTTSELAANRVFFQNALVGLISTTATFFVLEQVLQKSLIPRFFPEGGLYVTPKTARIRIRTRFTAFIFAVNLIPFIALLILVQGTFGTGLSPSILLEHVRSSVITNSLISISVGICLTVLVSLNLSRPINGIILVLKKIREGYLDGKVKVTTNDEIGYAGDVINEMTSGLKERERMKHSLELAKEVQLKLLPQKAPTINGLDIAGISLYCDETGGDYFDYLELHDPKSEKVGVVVGDVSDHGVHSALLMTTARAFLRLRSSISGNIADIVSDVNLHLTYDIEDGGQFMTLFFLRIDLSNGNLHWVRAGHDPAIIYDPVTGQLEELKGAGIPLGIDENYQYQMNSKAGLAKGQIIVISTDGIWEARNGEGEIFGKNRFYEIIRQNAGLSAPSLLNLVVSQVEQFQSGHKIEDDITMVIIKIEKYF